MSNPTPPGPPRHLPFGQLREFRRDKLAFMQSLRRYGDISLFWFGPFPAYYVSSPDFIQQVLVTDADKMYKSSVLKKALRQVLGNGLLINDGDSWKRQHKLVMPAFHSKRIGAYADVMVQYTQRMLDRWQTGEMRRIDEDMGELTMRIVAKTLFDADLEEDVHKISGAITTALKVIGERNDSLFMLPEWLPTRSNRALSQAMATLDALIERFIHDRRASGEDKGDLLSMLLAARDEAGTGMTDKQVRDEAMTLFNAGHETTAVALTWALYLLSQHPEVEAKLQDEVHRVLGDRPATLADLPNLPYTEMIVKEAMRLFPPAWGTVRELTDDVKFGDYTLAGGGFVLLSFHAMHHDERFFADPERFDPERFSAENEKRIPRYAYLPFGAGPRVCIGNMFAMMEARLVLATLAQRCTLSLKPGAMVAPDPVFTLRPKYGMPMIVNVRQKAAQRSSEAVTV